MRAASQHEMMRPIEAFPSNRRAGVFYAAPHASPSASVAAAPRPSSAVDRTRCRPSAAQAARRRSGCPTRGDLPVGVPSLPRMRSRAQETDLARCRADEHGDAGADALRPPGCMPSRNGPDVERIRPPVDAEIGHIAGIDMRLLRALDSRAAIKRHGVPPALSTAKHYRRKPTSASRAAKRYAAATGASGSAAPNAATLESAAARA